MLFCLLQIFQNQHIWRKNLLDTIRLMSNSLNPDWAKCRARSLILFVWFDSLRPINNVSVIKGRVFLGWTSTKLGLMFLLKDTTQWCRWGSNPRPFGLDSSTLPLRPLSGPIWAQIFRKGYQQTTLDGNKSRLQQNRLVWYLFFRKIRLEFLCKSSASRHFKWNFMLF